jgi:hypothetical protein
MINNGTASSWKYFLMGDGASGTGDQYHFSTDDKMDLYGNGNAHELRSVQVFRDPSAWYHIVIAYDTTQSTASDRIKLYVNGVEDALTGTYPSLNRDSDINNNTAQHIGTDTESWGRNYDGHMAEVHFIDGTALDHTSFGEVNSDYKNWQPKEVTGLTYGTNGFYLDFKDSGDIGNDANGSNNWTANNLAATDQMLDSPTNNFAVVNSIKDNSGNSQVLSEGNLKHLTPGLNTGVPVPSTIGMSSGKWYAEAYIIQGSADDGQNIGIMEDIKPSAGNVKDQVGSTISYMCFTSSGRIYNNSTLNQSSLAVGSDGNILGIAVDMTAKTVQFYLNNSSLGTAETFSGDEAFFAGMSPVTTNGTLWNFGQDSSFAGNKTSGSANANDGTYGDFYYTPPTDFLALCTNNLPAPAVKPQENFDVITYAGDDVDGRTMTNVGFQPDFVWVKCRNQDQRPHLFDSVRGGGSAKGLLSDGTDIEGVQSALYGYLNSFDSDGFTLNRGSDGTYHSHRMNHTSYTYVAWNWKAGGAGVSNTNGSITSTVSANVESGFSVVSFLGTGSNATVGHGLSSIPQMVFIKSRDSTYNWRSYNETIGNTGAIHLNLAAATDYDSAYFNNTSPTTTTFSVGSNLHVNKSGDNFIAYNFHSVDGYSKVGSYTGNGSTDGTFVYCGFQPKYVLLKGDRSTQWVINDDERSPYNVVDKGLFASLPNDEESGANFQIDYLSNGFKLRTANDAFNLSGTYIFIAFAEYPMKYTTAR